MSAPEAPEFVPLSIEELQEFFPQYEILSFIAAGGMGAVYLANQKSIDRRVAIKVLPRELSSDEGFNAQFRAEAKVMSRLNHPNLIGFFDFGEVDGMLFIIMEFVDGKSLHHSAHGEVIDQDTALELAIGITEGVMHAHKAGILHRDIKPANVLLDQEAFPKLGDFGLARPVEESEEGKIIYGTPGYTAPEVMENSAAIDERSDIFSIGAILYELLIGHLPEDSYRAPSQIRQVDASFDEVIKKAIAPDPDLRYPDTNAFLEDLKKIKTNHKSGNTADANQVPKASPQPTVTAAPRVGARPTYTPKKAVVKKSTGIAKMLAAVVILGALLALTLSLRNHDFSELPKVAILEWSRTKGSGSITDVEHGENEEEEREEALTVYHLDLLQKAKASNESRKQQREEAYQEGIKDAKWQLSIWTRGLTDNRREDTEEPLGKYISQMEKAGKLISPSSLLPSSVNDAIRPILDKQEEAEMIYRADLLKLKTAMQERLKKASGRR